MRLFFSSYKFIKTLIIVLVAIMWLLLLTFVIHSTQSRKAYYINNSVLSGTTLASSTEGQVERVFLSSNQIYTGISNYLQISDNFDNPFDLDIRNMLLEVLNANRFLMDIVIADVDGDVIHWTGPGVPPNVSKRKYFSVHKDNVMDFVYTGQPEKSIVHENQYFYPISRKLYDKNGKFVAVLAIIIDTKYLQSYLNTVQIHGDFDIKLFDVNKNVFAKRGDIHDFENEKLDDNFTKNIDLEKISFGSSKIETKDYIYIFSKTYRAPVITGVVVDKKEVLTFWYADNLRIGITFSSVSVIFLVLTIIAMKQISRIEEKSNLLRISEERYRFITENSEDVIWSADKDGNFTYVSPSVEKLRGYSSEEVMLQTFEDVATPDSLMRFNERVAYALEHGHNDIGLIEIELYKKDGSTIWTEESLRIIRDKDGFISGYSGITRDLTKRKELEDQLRKMAVTDPLTGIFNRRHVMDLVSKEIERSRRYGHTLSVLILDIDFFKKVNDRYGHDIGDKVIIRIVEEVKSVIRTIDIFGRIGGEEFVLILPQTNIDDAFKLSQRVRKNVEELSIDCSAGEIKVTISIGLTEWNTEDKNINDAIKRADIALYEAKDSGRNAVKIFKPNYIEG